MYLDFRFQSEKTSVQVSAVPKLSVPLTGSNHPRYTLNQSTVINSKVLLTISTFLWLAPRAEQVEPKPVSWLGNQAGKMAIEHYYTRFPSTEWCLYATQKKTTNNGNIQWQPIHKFSQPGIENMDQNLGEKPWWATKLTEVDRNM